MEIIRAELTDTDIFSEYELGFGACCFYAEDRLCKYFFEIKGQAATLFANKEQYIEEVIDIFLFYSGFVTLIKDKSGRVLMERAEINPYLLKISEIRPSQFYINEKKLQNCKRWIKSPKDIMIPVAVKEGVTISLDGHTRLRAALSLGYDSVYVYEDTCNDYIFSFADEAAKRKIYSVSDMELISDEEYKMKWHKFCDDFFKNLERV